MNKVYSKIAFMNFLTVFTFGTFLTVFPFIVEKYVGTQDDNPLGYALYNGIIISAYGFFQLFATPLLGSKSDVVGRKKILIFCMAGTVVSLLIFGFAYFVPNVRLFTVLSLPLLIIIISQAIGGMTGACLSVSNAYVTDVTPPEERTKIFGRLSGVSWLSLIFAPALGGIIASTQIDYLGTVILSLVVSIIALVFISYYIKEPSVTREIPKKKNIISELNVLERINHFQKYPFVRIILFIRFFVIMVFAAYYLIITVYLMDRFGLNINDIGVLYLLIALFSIINDAFLAKFFEKKLGTFKTFYIGQVILITSLIFQSFAPSVAVFMFFTYFVSLGFSFNMPIFKSFMTKNVPPTKTGELLGIDESLFAISIVISPLISNIIYAYTEEKLYLIMAIFIFIPHIVLMFVTKRVLALKE